ncbi:MAG: hypothetical protein JXI43_00755 [Tissierellales bacterium]|nr:hypothetical protein [Tissierellales bacterium]
MVRRIFQILVFIIQRPRKVLNILLETLLCTNVIVPFYNLRYPLVCFRTFSLVIGKGFFPDEALQLGLLDLNFAKKDLCKFISKRRMLEIQKTLNPVSWESLTEDKGIFYRYCIELGLPVPQLYAIFFRHTPGYTENVLFLTSRGDWISFIDRDLPSEFVVKPARGVYGYGIMFFSRTRDGKYMEASQGTLCNAESIYNFMLLHQDYETFVIQERLINHPELEALSDTDYLQTVRVLTFIDQKGQSRILHAFFKPIVGNNIVDNHEHGSTGNLLAEISLDTGILKTAVKLTPNASGIKTVPFHPVTGKSFENFRIPLWEDICKLVREVSLKFLPLRIVGWDIAITPKGLFIIEGNCYPDPTNFHQNMDVILPQLAVDN